VALLVAVLSAPVVLYRSGNLRRNVNEPPNEEHADDDFHANADPASHVYDVELRMDDEFCDIETAENMMERQRLSSGDGAGFALCTVESKQHVRHQCSANTSSSVCVFCQAASQFIRYMEMARLGCLFTVMKRNMDEEKILVFMLILCTLKGTISQIFVQKPRSILHWNMIYMIAKLMLWNAITWMNVRC
jgi:hypothetical protein